ncbi:MAG: hypothetical protein ACI8WB_005700 [Phenylobacterium sp.]|jgi:hypothetical protein
MPPEQPIPQSPPDQENGQQDAQTSSQEKVQQDVQNAIAQNTQIGDQQSAQEWEEQRSGEEVHLLQLMDNLTMAQKVALSELGRYGYNLAFIRSTEEGPLAIAMAEGKVMTIDDEGEIEPNPNIVIRK